MKLPGSGLGKGLGTTLKTMGTKSVTREYPDAAPEMPPRSRGVIALLEENCTSCMLCARECPDWCIYIDSHKETIEVEGAARPRQRNVLDRFAIDFSLCMYCGICIEVCPFDALFWSPEFEYAESDLHELTHEKQRLGMWMATVPPPPPLEVGATLAKEIEAAAPVIVIAEAPATTAAEAPATTAAEAPATTAAEAPATTAAEAPAAPAAEAPAAPTAETAQSEQSQPPIDPISAISTDAAPGETSSGEPA